MFTISRGTAICLICMQELQNVQLVFCLMEGFKVVVHDGEL